MRPKLHFNQNSRWKEPLDKGTFQTELTDHFNKNA